MDFRLDHVTDIILHVGMHGGGFRDILPRVPVHGSFLTGGKVSLVVGVAILLVSPLMNRHFACLGGSVAVLGIGYVLFMRKYFKLHLVVK